MATSTYAKKDWSELKVGDDEDVAKVPRWIKGLAKPDCPRWDNVGELDCLYDRGKIYSAAAKAVPEFIKLLNNKKTPNKDTILVLLGSLVCASTISRTRWGLDMNRPDIKKFYASGVAKEVRKSTWEGRDTYVAFLNDADAMVRSAAAAILAYDFDGAETNLKLIAQSLAKETEAKTKASMLLCLGLLQSYLGEKKSLFDVTQLANDPSEDALVRGAAVMAQIYSSAQLVRLTPEQKEILIQWCMLSDVDLDGYPWNNGETDMHMRRVVEGRCEDGAMVAAEILAGCIRRDSLHSRGDNWAEGILSLAFSEAENLRTAGPFFIDANRYDGERFSDRQRVLLETLSSYSFAAPFGSYGIPSEVCDRRRWLGLEAPGPMEQIVEVKVRGKLHKWPVWMYMSKQQESKPDDTIDVKALLGKVLTPTQILEVCLEYSCDAYGLRLGDNVDEIALEHSKELIAWARGHLNYMAHSFHNFGGTYSGGARNSLIAMKILIKEQLIHELKPEYDILIDPTWKTIYERFDASRREKFILGCLDKCFSTDDSAFWHAKHNVESSLENLALYPTEAIASKLFDIRDHIESHFNEFSDVAVEIETQCQKHARKDKGFAKVVKKRLKSSS